MIKISNLSKHFDNVSPLIDVNCEIKKGEIISIIGPSGTGKSTLLRCINMLETPSSGSIIIDGEDITEKSCNVPLLRQKMGMVFQNFNLFQHLMIIENIMTAPMQLLKVSKQEAYDDAIRLLKLVGLAEKALSYPNELSGGQQQRVAIARALAMKPEILLFDEPTSALDPTMVGEVLDVIKKLSKEGLTMLIVTHEMKFAKDVSSKIYYMDEGIIYEQGTPAEIFDNPKKDKTRVFVKRLKTYNKVIETKNYDFIQMDNEIGLFLKDLEFDSKKIHTIRMILEEVLHNGIIASLPNKFDLKISIEYNDNEGTVDLLISYEGIERNCLENIDDLALMIINKSCKNIKQDYEEGINKIKISF